MIKQTKKAFTLVELIVVITIIAILATIALLGFESYSGQARDSSRKSAISQISKQMSVKATGGSSYLDMIGTTVTSNAISALNVQGGISISSTGGYYKVGNPNYTLLGIPNDSKFKDPKNPKKEYVIGAVNTGSINAYEVAASLEDNTAYVMGTYSPRTSSLTRGSGSVSGKTIILSSNFGIFKIGDIVKGNGAGSATGKITSMSPDLRSLTVDAISITGTTISLANDESEALIYTSGGSNPVTNGGTNLPYSLE